MLPSLPIVALPAVMRFPNPVNEVVARLVAAGVVLEASAYLVTRWPIFLVTLAVGFVLRVLTGPRLSPLALLVTRVIVPRLDVEPRWVPGPPKRFAQGIGATLTVGALVAWLAGAPGPGGRARRPRRRGGDAGVRPGHLLGVSDLRPADAGRHHPARGLPGLQRPVRPVWPRPGRSDACVELRGRRSARRPRRQLPFVDQCQASPGRLWKPKLGALDRIQP